MSLSIVRKHFLARLKEATTMKVVPEGENFTVKGLQDYPFARVQILPRESRLQDIGIHYTTQEAGLLAIVLWFSRNTNTIDGALDVADEILDAFPIQNTPLDEYNQLIVQAAWVEAIRHEDNAFGVPIFVRWFNLA